MIFKKKITYLTKLNIILMNKAMNNEKKLNFIQSLNDYIEVSFQIVHVYLNWGH